jgi:hypothetical protein
VLYIYEKSTNPDLDVLEKTILSSALNEVYQYFRWDQDDKNLKVFLNRALNLEEEIILNNTVRTK